MRPQAELHLAPFQLVPAQLSAQRQLRSLFLLRPRLGSLMEPAVETPLSRMELVGRRARGGGDGGDGGGHRGWMTESGRVGDDDLADLTDDDSSTFLSPHIAQYQDFVVSPSPACLGREGKGDG